MSAPITEQEAKDMVNAYLAHPNPVPATPTEKLKGITIDRASLEDMLNPADGTQIDSVFFALGVDLPDVTSPPADQYFTVVAMGVDNNNDLKIDNAHDGFSKNPPFSPANYSSLFD